MSITIPGGKSKGTALAEADAQDISFWLKKKEENLSANPNHQYANGDRRWIEGAKAELQRRNGDESAKEAPKKDAITKAASGDLQVVGAFSDPGKITDALLKAQEHYHVITPSMIVGSLPPGCEVFTSVVAIDPYGPEVYSVTGNRNEPRDDDTVGIDRVGLARIGGAAAVSWEYSRRVDDRSHPHYCAWEAVLLYKQFDGQVCRVPGNVDIDVRQAGAAYEEIVTKAEKRKKEHPDWNNDGGASQLLELRKFLVRHCESKAMNKAVGNMGVRRSYKRSELRKPFLVARVAFTGRTEDPELRRLFATMIAQQHLNAHAAMYGGAPNQLLPAAPSAPQLQPPPELDPETYDYDTSGEDTPSETTEKPKSSPAAAPAASSASTQEQEQAPHGAGDAWEPGKGDGAQRKLY
jgi:hypothetical protein